MEIGTIGAGAFAQAFAKRALKAGHKVKLSNQRGPGSLAARGSSQSRPKFRCQPRKSGYPNLQEGRRNAL
jgi:predicted dinucleotide-binding enzyme